MNLIEFDKIDNDKIKKQEISKLCSKNLKNEADAMEHYYPLLERLILLEDEKNIKQIMEIIGDEKNHSLILLKIQKEYDNIQIPKD